MVASLTLFALEWSVIRTLLLVSREVLEPLQRRKNFLHLGTLEQIIERRESKSARLVARSLS